MYASAFSEIPSLMSLTVVELVCLGLGRPWHAVRCDKVPHFGASNPLPGCCCSVRRLVYLASHHGWPAHRFASQCHKSTLAAKILPCCHCHFLHPLLSLLVLVSYRRVWQVPVRHLRIPDIQQRDQPGREATGFGCVLLGHQPTVRCMGVWRLRCFRASS